MEYSDYVLSETSDLSRRCEALAVPPVEFAGAMTIAGVMAHASFGSPTLPPESVLRVAEKVAELTHGLIDAERLRLSERN